MAHHQIDAVLRDRAQIGREKPAAGRGVVDDFIGRHIIDIGQIAGKFIDGGAQHRLAGCGRRQNVAARGGCGQGHRRHGQDHAGGRVIAVQQVADGVQIGQHLRKAKVVKADLMARCRVGQNAGRCGKHRAGCGIDPAFGHAQCKDEQRTADEQVLHAGQVKAAQCHHFVRAVAACRLDRGAQGVVMASIAGPDRVGVQGLTQTVLQQLAHLGGGVDVAIARGIKVEAKAAGGAWVKARRGGFDIQHIQARAAQRMADMLGKATARRGHGTVAGDREFGLEQA